MKKLLQIPVAIAFWVAVAIGLLLGCDKPDYVTDPMEQQDEAIAIVWNQVYGRSDSPPEVRWVMGAELDCTDPNSGEPGFMVRLPEGRECRNGYTVSGSSVYVSWSAGTTYSTSALAHELAHAGQLRRNVYDPFHLEPGTWEMVDLANATLAENGL